MRANMNRSEFQSHLHLKFNPSSKKINIQSIVCLEALDIIWLSDVRIRFDDCIFNHDISLNDFLENSEIVFNNCLFKGAFGILGSNKSVTYRILNSNLENGFTVEYSDHISLFMGKSEGRGEFIFDNVKFEQCSFAGFKFSRKTEYDRISFTGCSFNSASFKEAELSNPCFNASSFSSDVSFDWSSFNYNSTPGTGNFFDVTFECGAFFNGTNFTKGAMFNGAKFKGAAIFVGCNQGDFECKGDFSGCRFEKRVFFDSSKFKTLVFKHVEFREVASFNKIQCEQIKLSKNVFLQYADFLDAEIKHGSRDSFRTIKNEFLRHNNGVEALVYQAKELRIYEASIKFNKHPKEKIVLWFYKISNDFGINWVRGIFFTISVSILFYLMYLLTLSNLPFEWGWEGWYSFIQAANETVKYFFKFFIITHDIDFMSVFQPNAGSYLIDSLARIFIAYGVYQTVQAFRKYGK